MRADPHTHSSDKMTKKNMSIYQIDRQDLLESESLFTINSKSKKIAKESRDNLFGQNFETQKNSYVMNEAKVQALRVILEQRQLSLTKNKRCSVAELKSGQSLNIVIETEVFHGKKLIQTNQIQPFLTKRCASAFSLVNPNRLPKFDTNFKFSKPDQDRPRTFPSPNEKKIIDLMNSSTTIMGELISKLGCIKDLLKAEAGGEVVFGLSNDQSEASFHKKTN
eukprot:TRINITY_DN6219_c0_g1_i3.p1 TRINITY_DN6219_c0_g1~~TRINITY_DN6219_c0_g1_i3.p1  ORF type:complete len:222 (+),score=23.64 TRINITY_DN6219_c0_g1_i3:135-800(+)